MTADSLIPEMQWQAPVKNLSEVQDSFTGAVDVISWWLNLFGDNAIKKRLTDKIAAATADAKNAVEWTGANTGALLWIRVIRLEHQDTPLRVTGLLDDGPMMLALGRTPADALFEYISSDRLISVPPNDWTFDDTASFYIWVSLKNPNGMVVPAGTIRDLTDEVKARYGEFAIARFRETFKTGDILTAIVQRAKKRNCKSGCP